MKKTESVQIRVTGRVGQVDGYVEMILGIYAMSGLLLAHKIGKRVRPGGVIQIYLDMTLKTPPLGNIGTQDIPVYHGDNE